MDELMIERIKVKCDPAYPAFGIVDGPKPHKQHPNQQSGLDLYVRVINFDSGELCFKKLYENAKGLHFKHAGYSPMYLADFVADGFYVPFQVFAPGRASPLLAIQEQRNDG